MAIDKSRTSLGMKIVLIILIVAFVSLFIPVALSGLFTQNRPTTSNGQQGGTGTVDAINQKYAGSAQTFQSAVASDPTSYTALVNLGNTFLDWGGELLQASQTSSSAAVAAPPLILGAKDAYTKALKVKKGDPAVGGDLALTFFYSGDVKGAIRQAEEVAKSSPEFAQNLFNLANFYRNDGQRDKAVETYQRYLKLEPTGERATTAQQAIKDIQAGK